MHTKSFMFLLIFIFSFVFVFTFSYILTEYINLVTSSSLPEHSTSPEIIDVTKWRNPFPNFYPYFMYSHKSKRELLCTTLTYITWELIRASITKREPNFRTLAKTAKKSCLKPNNINWRASATSFSPWTTHTIFELEDLFWLGHWQVISVQSSAG